MFSYTVVFMLHRPLESKRSLELARIPLFFDTLMMQELLHLFKDFLCCPRSRPLRGRSHATIDISTRDGEVFPVKRKLLRPCILLTHAVRSDTPSVTVAVDTLVFDRCSNILHLPWNIACPLHRAFQHPSAQVDQLHQHGALANYSSMQVC